LDTTQDDSTFDGDAITNTLLPVTRNPASGVSEIDVFKAGLDMDALTTWMVTGVPSGLSLNLAVDGTGVELIGFDAQLQGFFGIGQEMTFDPNLRVILNFSKPTAVETSPGVWKTVTSTSVPMGSSINARHPGGDLTVDPAYSID